MSHLLFVWFFLMTLNSEFHLGKNRSSWQTVAPTLVGARDLSFTELTGGTRPEYSGFWSVLMLSRPVPCSWYLALNVFWLGYIVDQIHSTRRCLTNLLEFLRLKFRICGNRISHRMQSVRSIKKKKKKGTKNKNWNACHMRSLLRRKKFLMENSKFPLNNCLGECP